MANQKLSSLDLVRACDNFPYDNVSDQYYKLLLPYDDRPHGYMTPEVVQRMPWSEEFHIDHQDKTVTLRDTSDGARSLSSTSDAAFAKVIGGAIENDTFEILHGKHSELFPILGAKYPVALERFAGDLFGIAARGAHLTVFTDQKDGLKIWVPRRSPDMFTYPNKLDTTVAGGVPSHQTPFQNIIQEADEEASLPFELIKRNVCSAGALTYIGMSEKTSRGEQGLVLADIVYVFDMEVGPEVVPVPKDGEVKDFDLMTVEEVREALARGEFKTNSAVVMIDFFIRHGIITQENEKDYVEIVTRMHRRLPFPTSA